MVHNTILIKIKGYNKNQIKTIVEQISATLLLEKKRIEKLQTLFFWYKPTMDINQIKKKSYIHLPKKKKSISLNRSPFIFKKSGETFIKKEINANIQFTIKNNKLAQTNILIPLFKKLKKQVNLSNLTLLLKIKKTVMVK